jgi:hypothetical protein
MQKYIKKLIVPPSYIFGLQIAIIDHGNRFEAFRERMMKQAAEVDWLQFGIYLGRNSGK